MSNQYNYDMKKCIVIISAYWLFSLSFAQNVTRAPCTTESFVVKPVTVSLWSSENDCWMEILPGAQKRLIDDFNKQSLLFSCPDILKAYWNLIADCRKWPAAKWTVMFFDYHLARVIDDKIRFPLPWGKTILDSFNKTYDELYVSKKWVDNTIAAKTQKAYLDPYKPRSIKPKNRTECAKIDLANVTSLSQIMDSNYVCKNIRDLRLWCEEYFDASVKAVPWEQLFDKITNQSLATQLCTEQLTNSFNFIQKKVYFYQKTISSDYRQQQTKLASKLFYETFNNITSTFDTIDSKFWPVLAKTQCSEKKPWK